ncbi:putative transposase ISC1217 [Paenibacillus sp. UNCCL117]|uniref:IS4 family transposase n=1 Tax=unclassified Paenibacillus TaxID=185978 RepID=UPI000881AC46|nr:MULTISPECIES: transposase [unclassified Paenibacillus]SDE68341.1 putative transposase ISC1217 [Paenibacillus sp. cl123]SFW70875.1 putative transposase ISC1217 [Paenibacillus sp. UNCCL117]
MIDHQTDLNQLPNELKSAFQELNILKFLRQAGFRKRFGFRSTYLFQLVFVLLFHQKNWFRLLESSKAGAFPGKDAVYRFLNHAGFAWRRFLTLLGTATMKKVDALTSADRDSVFIVDDSMFERNRSKMVELLARFKDHATGTYYKGFRMLTMGWSDGHTFLPLDFALLSSGKSAINEVKENIDKRSHGYKRRQEALLPAPEVIVSMLDRALKAGATASYVLMDSWFTHAPLIGEIVARGLDVIGMVKNDNKHFLVQGRKLSLQELYAVACPVVSKKRGILRSIQTKLASGIPIRVVFVRHRTKKNEWLAILTTDLALTVEDIIRIYAVRWDIEVFFKCTKSLLRLQKEFQGRSYDLLISHTTIVFSRYMLLAWQHRQSTDARSFGGLFYLLCDEVGTLDWVVALQQLLDLINEVAQKAGKKISALIQRQLQQWIAVLPSYIKACLPISCCES